MTKHDLKTLPQYFMPVISGLKSFEVRKNDRNFKVGDQLLLKEWSQEKGYTKREVLCDVTYILDNTEYCKEGFVVMAIVVKKAVW